MGRRHVLKDVADKKLDPTKKHVTKGGRIDLGTKPKEAEPVDVVVEETKEEVEKEEVKVEKILDVKPSFKKLSSTSTTSKTTRKTRSTRSKKKDS